MWQRIGYLLTGMVLAVGYLSTLFTGQSRYFRGFKVDPFFDLLLFIVGCTIIVYAIFYPKEILKKSYKYIGPKCEKVSSEKKPREMCCEKCSVKMEILDGYYKRHINKKIS